jgi:hypothetical protein
MAIRFTQYLRPDGRKRAIEIDCPAGIEALAERFIAAGGRYECEELNTGHASLTAVHEVDGEDQDIAIELCRNEPTAPDKVDVLVRRSIAWLERKQARRTDRS